MSKIKSKVLETTPSRRRSHSYRTTDVLDASLKVTLCLGRLKQQNCLDPSGLDCGVTKAGLNQYICSSASSSVFTMELLSDLDRLIAARCMTLIMAFLGDVSATLYVRPFPTISRGCKLGSWELFDIRSTSVTSLKDRA